MKRVLGERILGERGRDTKRILGERGLGERGLGERGRDLVFRAFVFFSKEFLLLFSVLFSLLINHKPPAPITVAPITLVISPAI